MISSSNFHCYSYCLCCIYFMSCPTNEHYKYLATKIKLVARYKIVQRQKICLICRLTHFMMPGSKGLNPHELAHRWMKDLGTRPDMEQNIQWMFVLLRPKRGNASLRSKYIFLNFLTSCHLYYLIHIWKNENCEKLSMGLGLNPAFQKSKSLLSRQV